MIPKTTNCVFYELDLPDVVKRKINVIGRNSQLREVIETDWNDIATILGNYIITITSYIIITIATTITITTRKVSLLLLKKGMILVD